MAVEVKIEGDTGIKRKYPYSAKHNDGTVIYFIGRDKGVALILNDEREDPEATEWLESAFTPMSPSESITLRNV